MPNRTKWDELGHKALAEAMQWPREKLLAEIVSLRLDLERAQEDISSLKSQLHYMDQIMPDRERRQS